MVLRFVLDSADAHMYESARRELHGICELESLYDIPVLVLANKNDLPESLGVEAVRTQMDVRAIRHHQVACYSISVKEGDNLDAVLSWLVSRKTAATEESEVEEQEEQEEESVASAVVPVQQKKQKPPKQKAEPTRAAGKGVVCES